MKSRRRLGATAVVAVAAMVTCASGVAGAVGSARSEPTPCARLTTPKLEHRAAPTKGSPGAGIDLRDTTSDWGLEEPLTGMLVHAVAAAT